MVMVMVVVVRTATVRHRTLRSHSKFKFRNVSIGVQRPGSIDRSSGPAAAAAAALGCWLAGKEKEEERYF